MTAILKSDFETKIGTIRTWIEAESIQSPIELQEFDLRKIWDEPSVNYETGIVWRWFINKNNNSKENLSIFCQLLNPTPDLSFSHDGGEHLNAILIENNEFHLHMGTEDSEAMLNRAELNDWMPGRLRCELVNYNSFTKFINFGFKISVPDLKDGEKIYFHFIISTKRTLNTDKDYFENDVSTWLAVEHSKIFIDERMRKIPADDE